MKRNGKLNALRILFLVILAALLLTLAVKALWAPPQQVTVKLETAEEPVDSEVFDVEAKEPSQVRADSPADGLTYLGEFRITHYCACSICCGQYADGITATGTAATEGRTIAVDPSVIPYGSRVAIFYDDGSIRYYTAEDSGSGITGKTVDVFIADHSRALELGVNSGSVYIVSEE